ncbi:MAG: phosphoribosylformylglycinamidine cyclo-ligase [Bacteroidia bacterium]|nr:phosphoribosylformylglycinamidine cyclo-ligase [Bacteroidia bacterium]MDW8133601.1 phosphoribosylformylglycinamidine cyclo-ligase [Bacteroidia bacterium]
MKEIDWYRSLGVSAHKSFLDDIVGSYPPYFVKVLPDPRGNVSHYFTLHADGVGTKGILSYLWWREKKDIRVWRKLAQDALVMNTDDLACAGITQGFVFSTTITRNTFCIPDEVVQEIVVGVYDFVEKLQGMGIDAEVAGGETADMPDVVRTISVEGTAAAHIEASKLLPLRRPTREAVIIGLASAGQAIYENEYNSGIGCNGITAIRHLLLSPYYAEHFPETFTTENPTPYSGKYMLKDKIGGYLLGDLLTSPTRTYVPILKEVLFSHRAYIYAIIHCTGGGQRKVLKYLPYTWIHKENLFPLPPLFSLLEGVRPWKELFETLNMGHRMEIYAEPEVAEEIIRIVQQYGVEAQIIGIARPSEEPTCVEVKFKGEQWRWQAKS